MTSDLFSRAFAIVLGREGGLSSDPQDPGGQTVFGIARVDHPGIPWPPTLDQATAIYRAQYWTPNACDDLLWPVCLAVFDCAVNQGNRPASIILQHALGVVQDGNIGPVTLAAAHSRDPIDLSARIFALRALRYDGTANFDRFGEGWMYRMFYESLKAA